MSERGQNRASDAGPIVLHVHPPERRRRSMIVASPSCCCCCCCLHTVGGLVGAGVASARPQGRSAVRLYWVVLGLLTVLGLLLTLALNMGGVNQSGEALMVALFALALGMPLVQLAASLMAFLIVALRPEPPVRVVDPLWGPEPMGESKADRLRAVGRITGYSVLGTLLGMLLMWLLCAGFGGCR